MSKFTDGGPAFPCSYFDIDSIGNWVRREQYFGITARDLFAAFSLKGMNSNPSVDMERTDKVRAAYDDADAMLAEREKTDA